MGNEILNRTMPYDTIPSMPISPSAPLFPLSLCRAFFSSLQLTKVRGPVQIHDFLHLAGG